MRVAGLAPVDLPGIENYNVTEFVPGHMSYRTAMPRLLREVGWAVESDEFTEIEDPDPENHEKRQRELINEIEEARKQLQEKPAKSRFGWFRRKNAVEKKEWETYDEKFRDGTADDKDALEGKASGVLFDVDALRAEVAELAAQGIQVKELPESTLPPMRIDLAGSKSPIPLMDKSTLEERSHSAPPNRSTFGTPPPSASYSPYHRSPSPPKSNLSSSAVAGVTVAAAGAGGLAASMTALELERTSTYPDASSQYSGEPSAPERPAFGSSYTMPAAPINLEHNAWADEFGDDFGREKEMEMTFE